MGLSDVVYGVYERRLYAQIPPERRPRHVGVILDGNRRWASEQGATSSAGHRAGAAKIVEFLGWCDEAGVEVVTLWLLSTDNLTKRDSQELADLIEIIAELADELSARGKLPIPEAVGYVLQACAGMAEAQAVEHFRTRDVTEQDIIDLEREATLKLLGTTETQARIKYMLETGKPLRN